jgi:hypothetical protein
MCLCVEDGMRQNIVGMKISSQPQPSVQEEPNRSVNSFLPSLRPGSLEKDEGEKKAVSDTMESVSCGE